MIAHAVFGSSSIYVVFKLFAVGSFVGQSVRNFRWYDRNDYKEIKFHKMLNNNECYNATFV